MDRNLLVLQGALNFHPCMVVQNSNYPIGLSLLDQCCRIQLAALTKSAHCHNTIAQQEGFSYPHRVCGWGKQVIFFPLNPLKETSVGCSTLVFRSLYKPMTAAFLSKIARRKVLYCRRDPDSPYLLKKRKKLPTWLIVNMQNVQSQKKLIYTRTPRLKTLKLRKRQGKGQQGRLQTV